MSTKLHFDINTKSALISKHKRNDISNFDLHIHSKYSFIGSLNHSLIHLSRNRSIIFKQHFYIRNNCMYSIDMRFRIRIYRNKHPFICLGILVLRNFEFKYSTRSINFIILYDARYLYIHFVFISINDRNFNELRDCKYDGDISLLC